MTRFRALIFDVDGTMSETEEAHRCAFNASFRQFSLDWVWDVTTYRQLLQITGGKERIRHYADTRKAGGVNNGTNLTDGTVAELHRFKNAHFALLIAQGACSLRPGVERLIRGASGRGQRLGIATTTSRENVTALVAATLDETATNLFDSIVCGEDVVRKKPAPDVYKTVLSQLRLQPDECLAIEDSRNGLAAANAAGVPALVTRSLYFRDDAFDGALAVVDSLYDVNAQRLLSQLFN